MTTTTSATYKTAIDRLTAHDANLAQAWREHASRAFDRLWFGATFDGNDDGEEWSDLLDRLFSYAINRGGIAAAEAVAGDHPYLLLTIERMKR